MKKSNDRKVDGTKALWHMDRVIAHYDKGERIAPVHLDVGIAKFCNIDCIFCYGFYQTPEKVYIQREPLLQTMRDAGEIGVRSMGIIGDGEPTCNPHLYEALYEGKKAGVDLALSTNGILLHNEERRKAVLENVTWMRFCLAAGTEEGYKTIHRSDKFNKVIKNIEALVNEKHKGGYKTDIGLQSVFVPSMMIDEVVEEAKLAVKLGVDYFLIKQCSLPDAGQTGMIHFDLNDYDKPEVKDALKKCEDMSTEQTAIIPKWGIMALKGTKPYEGCKAPPLISEISGNGDWFPGACMFGNEKYEEFKFGNVEEKNLKEIWESDRYWKIIEKMKKFDVQNSEACGGCCRLDPVNIFLDNYLTEPKGRNFI